MFHESTSQSVFRRVERVKGVNMGELVKIRPGLCASCIYRMGFGSQPNRPEKEYANVACNYLDITGHSRIFQDGEKAYDPRYCDKYEEGEACEKEWNHVYLGKSEYEAIEYYKMERINHERSGKKYKYEYK